MSPRRRYPKPSTMSWATSVPASTVINPRNMLLNLPRELRDNIYRYVVKGIYVVGTRPDERLDDIWDNSKPRSKKRNPWSKKRISGAEMLSPNLSILRVSKTISAEAMVVLYSDSTFRIYVHVKVDLASQLSSIPAVEHMMNIELDVSIDQRYELASHRNGTDSFLECSQQIWKAILGCIGCTNIIRKSLYIRWWRSSFGVRLLTRSDSIKEIPEGMYRRLKPLTGFRTVVFQSIVYTMKVPDHRLVRYMALDNACDTKIIRKYLKQVLGPADSVSAPRYKGCAITLTFHPRQHITANLKARAADLRAKADELNLEAQMAEKSQ